MVRQAIYGDSAVAMSLAKPEQREVGLAEEIKRHAKAEVRQRKQGRNNRGGKQQQQQRGAAAVGDSPFNGGEQRRSSRLAQSARAVGGNAGSGGKGGARGGRNQHQNPARGSGAGSAKECLFWRQGKCRQGAECRFQHGTVPATKPAAICRHYRRGACMQGDSCSFSHDLSTEPCKRMVLHGTCNFKHCEYSHNALEPQALQGLRQQWVAREQARLLPPTRPLGSQARGAGSAVQEGLSVYASNPLLEEAAAAAAVKGQVGDVERDTARPAQLPDEGGNETADVPCGAGGAAVFLPSPFGQQEWEVTVSSPSTSLLPAAWADHPGG
mmetsp:Transcript_39402/g.111656  ORF Transcript_39402/g.111656 Transcript_39402/m.111656 type:complete len:326 (-) Transcript_39402:147-1124(-)